jgi:xanthine dehydrogenase accessory factor
VNPTGTIWIQGAGELGSGVAVRLFRSGYRLVLADIAKPLAVRRLVAFSEAIYQGRTLVEDVPGVLGDPAALSVSARGVTVVVDPGGSLLPALGVEAVVDARMTKAAPVTLPTGQVPVIGLGPGFTCGQDADLVIETHREARLGAVIAAGSAAPNTGVAGSVAGETVRRVVRAPAAGNFSPLCQIGDLVQEGDLLGHVNGVPVTSALGGMIRGLVHPEAELLTGTKVGDVDPRGRDIDPSLVSDKSLAVGGGVLEALLRLGVWPARDR